MTPERWSDLKSEIKSKFSVLAEYQEELDSGTSEVLEFVGPMGKIKIKLLSQAKVLGKKTQYSNRIGSGVKVEYIYDPEVKVHHLEVYQWSEDRDDWLKVEGTGFFK
ncbi:MAG: hypothetical protein WC465_01430 [Patescibacteria group bacterium]